jgi:hypothetical protein
VISKLYSVIVATVTWPYVAPTPQRGQMKNLGIVAAAALTIVAASGPAGGESQGWVSLFNGKDLTGWVPKVTGYDLGDNFGDTFRVEDGVLKVAYDAYDAFDGRFGHLFYAESFSNYVLRIEYRFVGTQVPGGPDWAFRNSGIMIHGQPAETMQRDADFPASIEVQLLGGDGTAQRPTVNLCTPGTHVVMNGELVTRHCTSSSSKTYHGDQWVMVEVEVRGNAVVRHLIDGEVVLEYSEPQLDESDPVARQLVASDGIMLSGGSISLQSESHPVEFRKVELRRLR